MARADDTELIDRFEEFYRSYYRNEIGELAQKYPNEQKSLSVDWQDLYRFDPDLADDFRNKPQQLQEYAEEALRLYDLPVDVSLGQAHVRVRNLPQTTGIREIRADHRGMLIQVQGIVRKATEVRPKITTAAFECQRCGTLTRIPQNGDFQEPHECQGCERQGPFRINFDQSEFIDAQKLRVQESPEGLQGGETPQSIDVNIEDDITGEVTAGDHVAVTGTLKLEQQGNDREKSAMFDTYMDGHTVEIEDEQFEEMDITDEDKKRIIELSNRSDIYDQMVGAIAPSIYGFEVEKRAMIFQLFSGVTKFLPDESRTRGDLHILLVGDPGTGKCQKGDTRVTLGNGVERELGELVEENLNDPISVDDGVYQNVNFEVLTTDGENIETGRATKVWKREAPERMYQIKTKSGRELEVTPSHPLFVQQNGSLEPKKASDLSEGEFLAAPTSLQTADQDTLDVDSDIGWDQIESIEAVRPDYDWVYDLEVEETHSYISEGVVSHNSQLLQYVKNIAPRSVYTSGKGSSAAGLCVTGDTIIHTEDGLREIEEVVEDQLPEPVSSETSREQELSVYTFDRESGETTTKGTSHVWRMPEKHCRRIETANGKELEASQNTPVLTCGENGLEWKALSEVSSGEHVAVPAYERNETVERSKVPVREYLELTDEKMKLTEGSIERIREKLQTAFGTLREAAAALGLSEDFIYDSLSNRHVPLEKLDQILTAVDLSREQISFERLMLRQGDSITLPQTFDADLMYLVGLVFGDGDIRVNHRDGNRGYVRISNSNETVLERATNIIAEKFNKEVSIEYQDEKVPCIRFYSATVARLFSNLGMQTPRDDLSLNPTLTTAEHAESFLRGLMDADGSVSVREEGGSSVLFSTISETLARQVQLMFETYGISAKRRERDRRGEYERSDGYVIESQYTHHFVEIYGQDIDQYADVIGFSIEEKRKQLQKIVRDCERRVERLPTGTALTTVEGQAGEFHNNVVRGADPGRQRASRMLESVELGSVESLVEETVNADLQWEEVVAAIDTGKKELFDLTVPETHNFVGNGIVTHNTAAAVRDDFGDGQQWTLEAGALVLADKGIAAVDELDKMRCVTGETLVHTGDGIRPIRELAFDARNGEVERHENGRTLRGIDETVWTMTEDGQITERDVTAVHEYESPSSLCAVTLQSGESLEATPDHPFFVLENGEKTERAACELEPDDWVYVPDTVPDPTADGGVLSTAGGATGEQSPLSPAHGTVMGYIAGDGNIFCTREQGYGIWFTNTEAELLADFERACRDAFDAAPVRHPSEQRADGVETVYLHGKAIVDELLSAGLNLETYDGKRIPNAVATGTRAVKSAFIRALADSEGCVDSRKVAISSASYELLLGTKMLLTEFGVTSQIQTQQKEDKRDIYALVVTDADSLWAFRDSIGFTLQRKQEALVSTCDRVSGDRTILDVLPDCGGQFETARHSLRLHQSECGLTDSTYCNFENGDANFSLSRANRVLERFEKRLEQANEDVDTLSTPCSWEILAQFKERYHVSQSELASGMAHSQQHLSREWGESESLRQVIQQRLETIVHQVAETDLSAVTELVRSDVKWRKVSSVESVAPSVSDGQIRIQRRRLSELLGCEESEAETVAVQLLDQAVSAESWTDLVDQLDRHNIPLGRLADRLDVAGSTVSRWSTGAVDGRSVDEVWPVARGLIQAKRKRVRALISELEERRQPKVYDLTVEGTHNFLANGMVVHNSEDQSAMHEALEQQSYHPETEVLLADGRRVAVGEFVDRKMEANPERVTDGVDCEILPTDDIGVHTVDLEKNAVKKTDVDRVSRHEAPDEFVRVEFSNGRDVKVTPEHPMFVDKGGETETVEAREIEEDSFVPAPRELPNSAEAVALSEEPQIGREKDVELPESLSPELSEILGFLVAEGHSYAGSSHEIGFPNQSERLLDRMEQLMSAVFEIESSETTNEAGTVTKRWTSTKLYRWFERNFPKVMHTAREKRIPAAVLGASKECIRRFLLGAFAGDGGVESEAMSFSTASAGLAEDYADALAKIRVASRIHHDSMEGSWKTYVMGDSAETFVEQVVDPADDRYDEACEIAEQAIGSAEEKSPLRYYRVTAVETIPNEGEQECEWVYDLTVEPTNTFVSQGVVLHNSISVSKAGINATLKSRCSLLGAANPTYGRFDQYEPIGEQIDLAPPLISRFDLIFTVTDQPDEEEDAELAEHILQTNYAGELNTHREETPTSNYTAEEIEQVTEDVAPTIEPEFFRKYVAYARRNCFPTMTEEAKSAIQDYYVDLRSQGASEDAPVPVTARKLEALVRLAEASARVRLSDTVEREDADRAIEIAQYCLEEIGLDPETGELDADVVETGTSKSQRDRIKNIRSLIEAIEDEYDEGAPVDVVIERAEEQGMDASKAEHEIDKLKQKGEVYEPQTNHLRTT
jgi:replicative DNA helicase Mcm